MVLSYYIISNYNLSYCIILYILIYFLPCLLAHIHTGIHHIHHIHHIYHIYQRCIIYIYTHICTRLPSNYPKKPQTRFICLPTCRGTCRSPESRSKAPPQPWEGDPNDFETPMFDPSPVHWNHPGVNFYQSSILWVNFNQKNTNLI